MTNQTTGAAAQKSNGSVPSQSSLIYDWNQVGDFPKPAGRVMVTDETLRDGLQSPSVTNPTIEQKIELLDLMVEIGVYKADVGLTGASAHQKEHVEKLLAHVRDKGHKIKIGSAGRTVIQDITGMVEVTQRVGHPLQADLFLGCSAIRQYTEGWDLAYLLKVSKEAIEFAHNNNLTVMFVTEDTTRAKPEDIAAIYTQAIDLGVEAICLADTVGHATPHGTAELVRFCRDLTIKAGRPEVIIDWHGHNDRGLAIANCLAALCAGADRVHGTALGVGERVGNAMTDQILVNLKLLGWIDNDLRKLREFCEKASQYCEVPIPNSYPVMGRDAFETGTGVHAAAVIKAMRKGDHWLADRVYSSVPAGDFGLEQVIRVGPMAGKSNIVWWLEKNGYDPTDDRVGRIFDAVKQTHCLLENEELHRLAK
jgi:isopropylmalate/homocitrate/citramalate synthase